MYVVTVCVCIQSNSEYDLSKIPMQRWYKLTTKKYWSTSAGFCIKQAQAPLFKLNYLLLMNDLKLYAALMEELRVFLRLVEGLRTSK